MSVCRYSRFVAMFLPRTVFISFGRFVHESAGLFFHRLAHSYVGLLLGLLLG